jgi:hypothetical protein
MFFSVLGGVRIEVRVRDWEYLHVKKSKVHLTDQASVLD